MPTKQMNRWINYGLIAFVAFILLFVVSIVFMDMPTPRDWYGNAALQVMGWLFIGLPIFSLITSLYGWYKIDGAKEKGAITAMVVVILTAIWGILMLYQKLG